VLVMKLPTSLHRQRNGCLGHSTVHNFRSPQ
jgi:hypothetical protein